MAERNLQYRVTSGRYTLPAALLVAALCRLAAQSELSVPAWGLWGGLLVHILTAGLLIGLNNAYGLIRQRASFQSAVYLLLVSLCPDLYGLRVGHVAGLAVTGSLFFLFRGYRSPSASVDLFLSAACLGVGCLVVPSLVFFLPLYWIGAYTLQALTARSFFGSLLGWMFPFWFLLGHAWFYGEMELFTAPFKEMAELTPLFQGLGYGRWGTIGYLFLLFLVAGSHTLLHGLEEKIRTRCCLRFLVLLGICLFVAIILQPGLYADLLPALAVCISILAGHLFVWTRGRAANVFFIIALLAGFVLYLVNLWMLF